MTQYEKITKVHKDIVEAKWRAQTANVKFGLKPDILLHLEESVAFLAEELLKLSASVEALDAPELGDLGLAEPNEALSGNLEMMKGVEGKIQTQMPG